MIDTHAHLYWDSFKDDLDLVLQRAIEANITHIINVGVDIEKSKEALKQINSVDWPNGLLAHSTIGIHPHEASKYSSKDVSIHKDIEELEQIYLSAPDQIVAIGECGLDFVDMDTRGKELQTSLFQAQIELAKKLTLPLLVHVRDDREKDPENCEAWDKVLDMVGNHPTLLHCYSGLPKTTEKVMKNKNLVVSFAATLTYPANDFLRQAASTLPLDRIVIETDCPFLPPQSKRGTRNEPANIIEVAKLIADIKNTTLEEVTTETTKNAIVIFKLKG
jgi:TatD DNase family protein